MISHGHDWADIQQYTLPQIEAYLAAIVGQENTQQRLAMYAARAAQADEKNFKALLKEFS